jgi:hypothetical protein
MKPEKSIFLGQHITLNYSNYEIVEITKEKLMNSYLEHKNLFSLKKDKVWCEFKEPRFIEKTFVWFLNGVTTIAIKYEVVGRSFYIDRTFKEKSKFKVYPRTKNVPKKLRGKNSNVRIS